MTSASLPRQLLHRPERGTGPAFGLALAMHLLLFAALAFAIRWKTEPVGPMTAELWGALPAPAAVAPAPVPEPVALAPLPLPLPAPTPEPEPRKADIVVEPVKPPPKKIEPRDAPKPEPAKPAPRPEPKKSEPVKKTEPRPAPAVKSDRREDARKAADARAADALRQKELERIAAATGVGAGTATGAAATGGGPGAPSGRYNAQVVDCVRPHIVFAVPEGLKRGQYQAEFDVQLLPTGEQLAAPRLARASGLAGYDAAVERAIRRCDPFPRPKEGPLPRALRLVFDPVDTR